MASKYPADALAPISVDLGILEDDKHAERPREHMTPRLADHYLGGFTEGVAGRKPYRRTDASGGTEIPAWRAAAIDPILALRGD